MSGRIRHDYIHWDLTGLLIYQRYSVLQHEGFLGSRPSQQQRMPLAALPTFFCLWPPAQTG